MKRSTAFLVSVFVFAMAAQAGVTLTLREASGALTAGEVSLTPSVGTLSDAQITLDITTLTLPDADDEVDFYVQTCRGDCTDTDWIDIENIHFDTTDDGTTAKLIIIIDGAKDGPGSDQEITGTDPAAGAEISQTVPANTIWLLRSFRFSLVTDATSATRVVHLILDDGTTTLLNLPSTGTQIASLTRNYNAHSLGGLIVPTDSEIDIGLPSDTLLSAGHRIATETTLIKAGDNFGAPQLDLIAWHDPSISTDGTMGDNLKSYDRPLGDRVRIRTAVTGATAPTYAYRATLWLRRTAP